MAPSRPPCSGWDAGRAAPLLFSPDVKSLKQGLCNSDTKIGVCMGKSVTNNKQTNQQTVTILI